MVGLGAVGARSARLLVSAYGFTGLTVLSRRPERLSGSLELLGEPGSVRAERLTHSRFEACLSRAGVVLLATPAPGRHWASAALAAGVAVVSVNDDPAEVRSLLGLAEGANRAGVAMAVGAGMAPGLSCLMGAWLVRRMGRVDELHVATLGTGGPACARRRHAALREPAEERRRGAWTRRPPGSGRELVWFPADVGGADCYRVSRPDPLLLGRAFPGLQTVTTRAAASRRDRMTSWLPMLRRPHPEGALGAVRLEARGESGGLAEALILGAAGRPAVLAGTVAATTAAWAAQGRLEPTAGGLAELVGDPAGFLAELIGRGVVLQEFEGTTPAPTW